MSVDELTKKVDSKLSVEESKYDRWSLRDESEISYGAFGSKEISHGNETNGGTYITTAINYTNGAAHIGHAYEATTSDALARYYRVRDGSNNVHFVTGTDEHGEKIAKTAQALNQTPIELCDKVRTYFKFIHINIHHPPLLKIHSSLELIKSYFLLFIYFDFYNYLENFHL